MRKIYLNLLLVFIIAIAAVSPSFAQNGNKCGSQDWLEAQFRAHPELRADYERREKAMGEAITAKLERQRSNPGSNSFNPPVVIPIVFHVVMNAAGQNSITDAKVLAQLATLNADYSGLNADSANVPAAFQNVRGHGTVTFCLAQRKPDGTATNGINRITSNTKSTGSGGNNDPIKNTAAGGASAWDPTKYVNVWLCNFNDNTLLGYATFPLGSPEGSGGAANQQGVVVLAQSIPGGTAAPYNLGRTLTHELGHFFWLRHINGDGTCANDFPNTPGIDDTPAQSDLSFGCPGQAPTVVTQAAGCGAASPNPPGRMFQNYMDYTDDGCMTMFTNGQNTRMEMAINMYRASLLTSDGCQPPAAPNSFSFNSVAPASVACGGPASASINLATTVTGTFSTPINLTAAGNPAGTTVTFSANPLTPGNSTNVTLNNMNTLTPGTYNVTVTGVGGAVTQTATLAFTVQAGTPPSVTTAPAAVSVCSGANADFSVVSPTAGVTYQWQVNTGAGFNDIAGATSATYSFVTAQSDNGNQYQVIISSLCGTTTTTPVGLTVNTAANITTQPANFTGCAGDDHTFSVVATGTGISYQWQVNTGTGFNNISGATSDSYTVSDVTGAQTGYQYQVVITATGSACPAPGVSDVATLTVNELPVVTASANFSSVCTGTSVELTADGAAAYTWAPGGSASNPLTITPEVNPSNPSVPNTITYTVTGTTDGCSSTATVDVTANPLPVVTLSATPNNTTFTVPSQTVTLTANVTPPGSSYTYDWDLNGVPVANNTNTLLVDLAHAGEYGVTVSIAGLCASTSNRINVIDSVEDRFYIYPNPNDGRFVIQLKNPNTVGNVTIFDSHGKRVKSQVNIVDRLPYQVISVDLRPVSSGIYVIAIYDKAGVRLATEKIVVRPN